MSSKDRGAGSVIKIILIVFLSIIILLSVVINIMFFKNDKVVHFMGKQFYLIQTEEMAPEIPSRTLVVSTSNKSNEYSVNDAIIYRHTYGNDSSMAVAWVTEIVSEEGTTFYKTKSVSSVNTFSDVVEAEDVVGKYQQHSKGMGLVISNVKSIPGIVLTLILPCVLLIVVIMVAGARNRRYENDINFDVPVSNKNSRKPKKPQTPLFEPDENINSSEEFIQKKKSISENFAKKNTGFSEAEKPVKPVGNSRSKDSMNKKVLYEISGSQHDDEQAVKKEPEVSVPDDNENLSGFARYKKQNEEAMSRYDSLLERNQRKDSMRVETQNKYESDDDEPVSRSSVDRKAAEIKLALQKTTVADAAPKSEQTDTAILKFPSETARTAKTVYDKEPMTAKVAANEQTSAENYRDNSSEISSQQTQTAAVNTVETKTANKLDEVKDRYINKKGNASYSRTKNTADAFGELMKVIDDEKKKLQ